MKRQTGINSGKARGVSMIELLVAVLVMGIGVLGITALQMVSLQNNRAALYRAEAVALAYDMMDRIRSTGAGAAYDGVAIGNNPAAPTNCNAGNCTLAQMVGFDVAVWKCSLGGFNDLAVCDNLRAAGVLPAEVNQPGLPGGDGAIAVAGNGVVTVTVRWTEPNGQVRNIVIDSS